MDGVLLAGGLASRLGPITKVTNKHLLPVYDKPMIFYGIELLRDLGCERIIIILGGNSVGDIVSLVRDGSDFGVDIIYKYQSEPKGISHAIALAEDVIKSNNFLVLLGDNLFGETDVLRDYVRRWNENQRWGAQSCVFLTRSKTPWEYGQPLYTYHIDGGDWIYKFVEKQRNVDHDKIVTGLYGLTTKVFDVIRNQKPSERGEYEITDTLSYKLNETFITGWEFNGFWSDCGTPEGLIEASKYMRDRDRNENTSKR